MVENVRSIQEEIRHFPCGTNPLPIRTRAEILPEGGPRCCPKPPGRAVILPQGSGEGRDSAPKEAKCAKCPKTPQRAACSAYYDPWCLYHYLLPGVVFPPSPNPRLTYLR